MPIHQMPPRKPATETLQLEVPKKVADAFREYAEVSEQSLDTVLEEVLCEWGYPIIVDRLEEYEPA